MDFRHLIVTCLFAKLRLPFDNQKVKENYAILIFKDLTFLRCFLAFFRAGKKWKRWCKGFKPMYHLFLYILMYVLPTQFFIIDFFIINNAECFFEAGIIIIDYLEIFCHIIQVTGYQSLYL